MSNEYYVTDEQNSVKHFSEIKKYLQSQLDDTRLYVCRGDWFPDFMDVRSFHGAPHADYPRIDALGNVKARQVTLVPNNAYLWKGQPMIVNTGTGLGEELMPADKPIMLDENAYLLWMRSMDPLTVLEGEDVYSESTLNSVEDEKGWVGILHPKNIVATRFRGTVGTWIFQANRLNQIAEFSPHAYSIFAEHDKPDHKERNQLYKAMFDNIHAPVTFFLHTFAKHYYDRENAVFDLSLHNDSRFKKQLVLKWEVAGGAAGERNYELEAGTMKEVALPLELASGQAGQRASVEVTFRLMDAGKEVKAIKRKV